MRRHLGLFATLGTALAMAGVIVLAANWTPGQGAVEEAAAEEIAGGALVAGVTQQTAGAALGGLGGAHFRPVGAGVGALARAEAQPRIRAAPEDDDEDDD
ncbi:MAG: hypothetical protein AB7P07_01160 [Hyphomonadaceae bacterium]